jgi:hypothetical protein
MLSSPLKNYSVSVIGVIVTQKRELTGFGIVILVVISASVIVIFDFPVGVKRPKQSSPRALFTVSHMELFAPVTLLLQLF